MTPKRIILLVLTLVVLFVGALFTIQNMEREALLSFSLGFDGAAYQLAKPASVPVLMWVSLGIGLFLGGGWGMLQRFTLGRENRELQRKLARASASSGSGSSDPWKS